MPAVEQDGKCQQSWILIYPWITQDVHSGWIRRLLDVRSGKVVQRDALRVVRRIPVLRLLQRPVLERPHDVDPRLQRRVDKTSVDPGRDFIFLKQV